MVFYVAILFLCAGSAIPLAALAWNRRPARGATPLFFFLLCVGTSCFAYAMNLSSPELYQKQFWNHAEYMGAAFLPPLMLLVALVFTDREKWLRPLPMLLLFAIPLVVLFANWTNDLHHLYYRRVWIEPGGIYSVLAKSRGPLYAIKFLYAYAIILTALPLLALSLRRAAPASRPQLWLLLAAFLLPLLLNFPYLFRLMPHRHVNLTLLGFSLSSFLISIAMFRYRLLSEALLEKQRFLSQLVASRETELRQAISQTLTAAESEARRIGQDIHDGLCQDLVAIARLAESIETQPDKACLPCRRTLDLIREQSAHLAGVARAYSHDLTLHELQVQSFPEALETLAHRTEQLFRADVEINADLALPDLGPEQNVHIYRIVREAISNAVQHGHARHVWIDLIQEEAQLIVSVTNDGQPLPDGGQWRRGLGLTQMFMRARLLGASLSLSKRPDGKTVAELSIPRPAPEPP